MTVPNYVRAILEGAHFEVLNRFDCKYSIKISKYTSRTQTATMRKELGRLCEWMKRHGYYFQIITNYPKHTCHKQQYADCVIDFECAKDMVKYIGADFYWNHTGARHIPKELQQFLNA